MRYSPAPFIFLPTFCRISCVLHFIGGDWLQVGSCFKSSERLKQRHPRAGTPTVNFISVVQAQVNQRKRRFNAKIRTLYVQHAPVIQTYWNTLKQWNHTESLVCAAIWVYFERLECEIFMSFAKEARCQQCSRTRVPESGRVRYFVESTWENLWFSNPGSWYHHSICQGASGISHFVQGPGVWKKSLSIWQASSSVECLKTKVSNWKPNPKVPQPLWYAGATMVWVFSRHRGEQRVKHSLESR